jgi:hypothetical protein
MRERVLVNTRSTPHLPVRVRMQSDGVRQRLAVLAPREGILAGRSRGRHSEALRRRAVRCGYRDELSRAYAAPVETIKTEDVLEFIQSWTDLRLLRAPAE